MKHSAKRAQFLKARTSRAALNHCVIIIMNDMTRACSAEGPKQNWRRAWRRTDALLPDFMFSFHELAEMCILQSERRGLDCLVSP